MKFKEWFNLKLHTGPYPTYSLIQKLKVDIVINVSEQYNPMFKSVYDRNCVDYHWFPMNEHANYDIGLNSIYAACWILYIAESQNKTVYLHCHAGANRSPTVKDAYHYMRTGMHIEYVKEPVTKEFAAMFITKDGTTLKPEDFEQINNNRLLENIRQGYLPAQQKMESFLKTMSHQFRSELKIINDKESFVYNINVSSALSLDGARLEAHI